MLRAPNHSRQREAISQVLATGIGPLTAEEIHARAKPLCPRIGGRTVFRHLHKLVESGSLVKVSFPGQPPRYERPSTNHHPHLVCWGCTQVFDLPCETPEVISRCQVPPGFVVQGEEVVLYGWCPACAAKRPGTAS